ncbi:phytanoyl-CoA dioxygenase family protein [Olivibacter ginsenosidimutans]|uniref:Phytanoyl-CoA dioxygenase family protein n=1 Tax=Olivibacter ginsenosidimutans TaxID=1176537 RepID=A0ABP9CC12_9SPHI
MNTTNLPTLQETIDLSPAEINDFKEKGHVLTPRLLNKTEVAAYRAAVNAATYAHNTEKRSLAERDTYGKAFLQIMNLWQVDANVRQFILARRFAKIAANLLGVDHVRIYHDQALYKEPQGGHTPWHQDQYYWPLDTLNTVTLWMPLVDISEEMGMLTFASGSHKEGVIENIAISDQSEQLLHQYIQKQGYPIHRAITMQAGDATWHYGSTLHHAPGNQSTTTTREVMTVIYFADGAQVTEPINPHQENDRKTWLAGLPVGALANSHLNPIVY